jgi:hypothetical protein
MLGFVVPIKPKKFSKDWVYDSLLLERTARSICGQTDDLFKMIIVYNEKPEICFEHKNIIFIHYPFKPVLVSEIEDFDSYVKNYYNPAYAERMMDKGKKIHYGCKIAMEAGCTYIMAVDSDDLVSNKLAQFIHENLYTHKAGWRIQKGFIYEENSVLLVKKLDIQNINGSTHIIRKDLITIPDFSTNIFWNYCLFEAHGYTYDRIRQFHNETLDDYTQFGLIYIVHKNNYSNILQLTKSVTIKNIIKKLLKGRLVSNSIRKEYNLYKIKIK